MAQLPPTRPGTHTEAVPAPDTVPTAVASATFAVPAPVVWQFRLDFMNLPEYNPDISDVSRVADGSGVGGECGAGARYRFFMADPRNPDGRNPVELWIEDAAEPTLVSAGMRGANEAYEDFVVREIPSGGCEAILTLWVTMPEGLSEAATAKAAAGSLAQIEKEVTLMKEILEGRSKSPSVH